MTFDKAKWIWHGENGIPNDWVLFKKAFEAEAGGTYTLHISAVTRYFLKINGTYAVLDGALLRDAYEQNSGFYDSVDISNYIKTGTNVLEILVWHYGNGGRNNNRHALGGLIFACAELDLYSGAAVQCIRHPAFGATQPPHSSRLYGGHNIGYDARKEVFAESDFKDAAVCADGAFGKLYQRPVPMFRFSEVLEGKAVREGGTYRLKLPHALHVMPYFEAEAAGGEVIDIRTDRYGVNGGPGGHYDIYYGYRTEYICKKGRNAFQDLDWYACEEIIFTVPESVTVKRLGYRISEYDTDIMPVVQTQNTLLNRLLDKCARTLKYCMRDNFMDCPDRERGQWIGDVSVQAPQVFYALDSKAVPLLKKAIDNFIALRRGDVLVGNVPGEHSSELPSQSLNAISEIGMIAEYYRFTGDKDILERSYMPSVRYLLLWEMDEDGLAVQRKGDWCWYDHLYNIDGRVLENCWYYSALKFARFTAHETGKAFDAALEKRIVSIEQNFDRVFWKGAYYTSSGVVDDRANAMAVLSGLADAAKYNAIKDVLVSVFNCTAYMEGYVCEALIKTGYKDLAFKRMMSRYYNLAQNENSTLWEDFYILGTKNHAWTGAPLTLIYKYFIGISSPDFMKTIHISPDFSISDTYAFEMDINGKRLKVVLHNKDGKTAATVENHTDSKVVVV